MANTLLTISMITEEALMVLKNELTFAEGVRREYSDQFAIDGAKIGDTVNVRRPGRFVGTSGPALNVEDLNETSIPVVVGDTTKFGDQFHVDTQFTTKDLRLAMGPFSDRVLKPAVAAVANRVDLIGLTMAKNVTANIVGTAGTRPTGLLTYLQAQAYLDSEAAPRPDRDIVIDQWTSTAIVDALKGLFVPQSQIEKQFRKGLMGTDSAGLDWKLDQNVVNHTFGSWASTAGTLTVNTATQGLAAGWANTSVLSLTTTQTLTLNQGDTISFAGVNAVNPQNRQVYGGGLARTFCVQTTVTQTGSGNFNVTVSPALIYGGQFQNVSASPAAGAAVTNTSLATGTANAVVSPQSILFHRNAYTLAVVDLPLVGGVDMAARATDEDAGLSIRVIRQYTINNDALPTRVDVLFGWAPLYQELACRVTG